jgi:hypothetical protein
MNNDPSSTSQLYDDNMLDVDASCVDALLDSSLLAVEASFTETGGIFGGGSGGSGFPYAQGFGTALTDFVPSETQGTTSTNNRGKGSTRTRGGGGGGKGQRTVSQSVTSNPQQKHQIQAQQLQQMSVGGTKSQVQQSGAVMSQNLVFPVPQISQISHDSIATMPATVIDLGILVSSHAYPFSKPSQLTTMELARRWNEQSLSDAAAAGKNGDTSFSADGNMYSSQDSLLSGWGIGGHILSQTSITSTTSGGSSSTTRGGSLNGQATTTNQNSGKNYPPLQFSPFSMIQLASQYARARAIAANNESDVDTLFPHQSKDLSANISTILQKSVSRASKSKSGDDDTSSPRRALRSSSAGGREHLRIGGGLLTGGGIDEPVTVPFGSSSSSSSSSFGGISGTSGRGGKSSSDQVMKNILSPGIVSDDTITSLATRLVEDLIINVHTGDNNNNTDTTTSTSSSSASSSIQPAWLSAIGTHLYPDILDSFNNETPKGPTVTGLTSTSSLSLSMQSSSRDSSFETSLNTSLDSLTIPSMKKRISEETEKRILQALLSAVNETIDKVDHIAFERVGGQTAFKSSSNTSSNTSTFVSFPRPVSTTSSLISSSTLSQVTAETTTAASEANIDISGVKIQDMIKPSISSSSSSSSSSMYFDPSPSPPPLPPRQAADPSAIISANARLQTIATTRALENYAKLSSHPLTSKKLREVQLRFLTLLKEAQETHSLNEAAVESALASGVISVANYTSRMRDLYQNATATSTSLQTAVRRKIEALLAEATSAGLIQTTFATSPSVSPGGTTSPNKTSGETGSNTSSIAITSQSIVNLGGDIDDVPMSIEEHGIALQQHVQNQQKSSPSQFSILRRREGSSSAPNSGSPTRKLTQVKDIRSDTPTNSNLKGIVGTGLSIKNEDNTVQSNSVSSFSAAAPAAAPTFMTPPHLSSSSSGSGSGGGGSGGGFNIRSSSRRLEPSLITPGTTAAAAEIRLSRLVMERAPEALNASPTSKGRTSSPTKSSSPASPATAAAAAINAARSSLNGWGVQRLPPPSPISPPTRPFRESSFIVGAKAKRTKVEATEASRC